MDKARRAISKNLSNAILELILTELYEGKSAFRPDGLVEAMREHDMPYDELATQMAVTPETVQGWMSGAGTPSLEELSDLCDILQVVPPVMFR